MRISTDRAGLTFQRWEGAEHRGPRTTAKEIIVSVERRTLLKAIAGGAGLASVQGLFPAWAQTGSRGNRANDHNA